MNLTNDLYIVTRETLEKVLTALSNNQSSSNGWEEYNNEDIIEALERLEAELGRQETVAASLMSEPTFRPK